jgi:hypothetical protein
MRCPPHANAVPTVAARRLRVGGERFYEVEGALYPSVTTVLGVISKPNLAVWARRTALEKGRELLGVIRGRAEHRGGPERGGGGARKEVTS